MEHLPYTFFGNLLHVDSEMMHVATALFVMTLLLIGVGLIYPSLRDIRGTFIPSKKFTLRTLYEIPIEMLASLCDDIIGHHQGKKYLPFVGTIFIFLFSCNLIGLIPGFLPPTENYATGAAIATIVLIAFNYFGFKESGAGYLKHFLAPVSLEGLSNRILYFVVLIALIGFQIFFATIELVSLLIRPVTLTIRLTVNLFADHLVAGIFSGLLPYIIPIPFLILGLLVAFLQAFIFTLLTMVYISLAVHHEEPGPAAH